MGDRLNKGFSLVELMVAMSLLSLIIFVGSMSYSTFIGSWSKINNKINSNINNARNLMLLRKSVNSTMAYLLRDEHQKSGLLFKGRSNGFVSLTSSPVFENEMPSYYQVVFEPGKFVGEGRLLYKETSSASEQYFEVEHELTFKYELVLAEEVSNFEIAYLGWSTRKDKLEIFDEINKPKEWHSSYNSFYSQILPEAISIKYLDKNNEKHVLYFDLLDGSEKLISRSQGEDSDA